MCIIGVIEALMKQLKESAHVYIQMARDDVLYKNDLVVS